MTTPAEMRSESVKIANQARALLDTITSENRSEKEAEFNRMMVDSDALVSQADAVERSEARARQFDAIATELPTENRSVSNDSDAEKRSAAIRSYLTGRVSEAELRAAGVGVPSDGGYTVADAPMAKLVETLVTFGPMLNSNLFTVLNTTGTNELPIPTSDDTANTAELTAEHEAYDETNIAFGRKTLRGYKLTTLVKASDEFLRDSSVQPESHINGLVGKRLGRKANTLLTIGDGSNKPAGIVFGAGVGITSAAAGLISADEALRLQYSVDAAYRGVGAYMANDQTIVSLRLLKDAQGRYVWGMGANGGQSQTLWDKPLVTNNDMANVAAGQRALIFGDMSAYYVRIAGGVQIKRLNELFAVNGQVGFTAAMSVDGIVTDAAAIKALVQSA